MHWVLDVEFKDALSRYRAGHGAKNMAVVRRFSLGLIRADKSKGKRQNTPKIGELEYGFPPPNPANEMTVNLESVPCFPARLHAGSKINSNFIDLSDPPPDSAISAAVVFPDEWRTMRFKHPVFNVISCALGFIFGAAAPSAARAGETHPLVIAANDGYGVEDCLAEAGECGQVVADAWCEAHGHGAAVSYGPASRFTGLAATKIAVTPEDYVVNCGD
jgi:hypothetical protein